MENNDNIINLRPHHLIDIFKHMGNGHDLSKPHPYGHAQHLIARKILDNPELEIKFVCENDDLCKPCCHLNDANLCDDVLAQLTPPISKQLYNDELDKSLFKMLGIKPGYKMTAGKFLETILSLMPDIVPLATHPGRNEKYTADGLSSAQKYWG